MEMEEQKAHKSLTVVLDTSVLIDDPEVMYKTGADSVVIPMAVMREIDGLKRSDVEHVSQAARQVGRTLDLIGRWANLAEGAKLSVGSVLKIVAKYDPVDGLASEADNKVVGTALMLKRIGANVQLLTTDANMRTIARVHGVKSDPYNISSMDKHSKAMPALNPIHINNDGSPKGRNRLYIYLRAANKFLFPKKIKLALATFTVLTIFSKGKLAETLINSLLLSTLVFVIFWVIGVARRSSGNGKILYGGKDEGGNDIWYRG
jgi:rRNA-processing protein FCF1